MDNILTTSLYLFSSLLQADAALLGLGAIFVIYGLQALENQFAFIMQEFKSHGTEYIRIATTLWVAKTDEQKAELLKKNLTSSFIEQLEFVASLSEAKVFVKKTIKAPAFIIGLHLCISPAILWLLPEINKRPCLLGTVSWISIIWFAVGVISAVWVAWNLIFADKGRSLKEVNPKLYILVHGKE